MLTDSLIRNAKPKDKPYKLPRESGLCLVVKASARLGGKVAINVSSCCNEHPFHAGQADRAYPHLSRQPSAARLTPASGGHVDRRGESPRKVALIGETTFQSNLG